MEFSFGPYKWLPKELVHERNVDAGSENYALGLHAPGFFDKILNIDKCLLQIDPANKVSSLRILLFRITNLHQFIMRFCVFDIFFIQFSNFVRFNCCCFCDNNLSLFYLL